MEKVKDVLGKSNINVTEHNKNVGAAKGTPAHKVKKDSAPTGFKLASQSSNLPDRPIHSKNTGNESKSQPGSK